MRFSFFTFSKKPSSVSKYIKVVELCERMTQIKPIKRPNCEEILESKNKWALDKNELIVDNHLRLLLEEKSKDKQSIYHIIYTKLYNN